MKTILLLALPLAMCPALLDAQTHYYVSPSGDDTHSGLSVAQAWRTIQHAMDHATPGSTVHILAGTYNEKVSCHVSGTPTEPITFRNYQNEQVTISGAGIATQDAVIEIVDQSYIIIEGLTIADNVQLDAQGILIEGSCQGIELRRNRITDIHFSPDPNAPATPNTNAQPLIVYGTSATTPVSGLIIEDNTIHHCRTGYSEALAINGNVDGFVLRHNTIYDITNIGIDLIGFEGTAPANDQARNGLVRGNTVFNCKSPYATAAGIYVDGARDILIEHNLVYQCQWGIEVGCEHPGRAATGIVVRNNWLYRNDDAGLAIGGFDYPNGSGKVVGCILRHNTLYDNDRSSSSVGGITGEIHISYTEQCALSQNIVYGTNAGQLLLYVADVGSQDLLLDYNLYYFSSAAPEFEYEGTVYTSLADYQAATGQDPHSLYDDPLFVDAAADDLHIQSGSPAFEAGDPGFSPDPGETDIDGESRLLHTAVDIGADELDLMAPVEWLVPFQAFAHGSAVVLKWATATESNTHHFEIERSADARHWQHLASVAAHPHSSQTQWYEWRDTAPLPGRSFYRLRQLDADGSFTWSNVATVVRAAEALRLWPNPAHDYLHLAIEGRRPLHTAFIYDARGTLVQVSQLQQHHPLALDIRALPAGTYVLQLRGPHDQTMTTRFEKQ